jgi:threonine dehydratase
MIMILMKKKGQGTLGKEMIEQMENVELDGMFIAVGGGGLMSGIATYVKKVKPKCKIYGCQPENSAVMYHSVKAGKLLFDVKEKPTLSDATAGAVEDGSITFEPCRQFVDEWIIVNEEEIKSAIKLVLQKV